MSEETTPTTETPEEPKETGGGLRKQLEATLAENKTLKAEKLEGSFKAIGLDPTQGLGKAIAKEYDGEISTEALAEYADSEYGHKFEAPPELNPQVAQIAGEQAKLDQVGQTAGSVAPPTEADALAKAEAEGDYQTTMAIKGAQVARQFQGR